MMVLPMYGGLPIAEQVFYEHFLLYENYFSRYPGVQ